MLFSSISGKRIYSHTVEDRKQLSKGANAREKAPAAAPDVG